MPPAETPDFDSMSPEEVMAWMESLAKRQGAKEGFLTDANMEIAEIDPTTVEIDEPGYVPFGEETRKPPAQEKPPASPPAPPKVVEPVQEIKPQPLPMLEDDEADEDTVIEEGSMAWLASLAADQGDGFPQMDLSALSAELAEISEEPQLSQEPTSPLDWLGSLTEESAVEFSPEALIDEPPAAGEVDLSSITDPLAAGVDPMLWLESLAKRQGARTEELTTSADMNIPTPKDAVDSGPGYAAFSIETEKREPPAVQKAKETVDPAAWLEAMAAGSREDTMSDADIQAALSKGEEIPPDQMEQFFVRQLERGLTAEEEPLPDIEEFDPNAPPVPAELPDWLLEQVQPPDEPAVEERQPALVDEILEPPDIQDLPDWLKVDEPQSGDLELESIFETGDTTSDEEQQFYSSDPWVQAFSEEAASDPDAVPEWYERNLRDPKRLAAVEQQLGVGSTLEEVDLPPEGRLPEGEPEAIPAWMSEETPDEVELVQEIPDWLSAPVETASDDIPDWLAAADVDIAPDEIPDWLRDTVETEEAEEAVVVSAAPPATEPLPATPPPAPAPVPVPVPKPVPAAPAPADVAAVLQSARTKIESGDLDSGLIEYERVIRANAAIEQVVGDLSKLVAQHKENPAVYRVLGDGLMRQGNLQAALDTYRKALNQL